MAGIGAGLDYGIISQLAAGSSVTPFRREEGVGRKTGTVHVLVSDVCGMFWLRDLIIEKKMPRNICANQKMEKFETLSFKNKNKKIQK